MKSLVSRLIFISLALISIGLISSCGNKEDDEEMKYVRGSVWIYKFPENEIPNYYYTDIKVCALALVFGKTKVDFYYLDKNNKILECKSSMSYKIKGDKIEIGGRSRTYNGYSLRFGNYGTFYRTKLAMSDLVL